MTGELTGAYDVYRLFTGKDPLTGDKTSRLEAGLWTAILLLPQAKMVMAAKELKAGNKALKGLNLTEKELKLLNKAGYFDDVGKLEKASGLTVGKNLQNQSKNLRNNLDDFVKNYKNSDEYLNLSNSQKKIVNRKLDRLRNGNVATAEVDILGLKKDFKAHSQIHSNDSLGYRGDFSVTPPEKDRLLKNYVKDDYPRYNDTEAKILEDIASKIKDPKIKGEINLFSELDCCQSCTNLILEFRQKYPNIKVNVITNNTLK
ncbi:deaminase domain-containing protein [Carnobacterium gallinarum]